MVHKLVHITEVPINMPSYRWHAGCTCGFECRLGTKEACQSQFDAHLQFHKTEPHFSKPITPEEKPEVKWPPQVK